jgi:hypothetical protein
VSRVKHVLVLGDPHDKPSRKKQRFSALGAFAAWLHGLWGLDAVVCIGDWLSADSLSHHETKGSRHDAERPTYHEELESLDECLGRFGAEAPFGVPFYQLHGNHEERVWTAANLNPKEMDDFPLRLEQVFARYGWQTRRYGKALILWGVKFIHTLRARNGKPSSAEFPELLFARKSVQDTVVGHSHIANMVTFRKNEDRVRIVNVGTAMPHGTRETYTPDSDCEWDYGAVLLRIRNGKILSVKFFDMIEIMDDFGAKA